ncbi:MAG: hypothetical protein M1816_007915 [Peltula sp. TS41687]|nr:MAG: hypothetical protein M1816_007915 [Peltula sp. TS41687]
MSGNKSGPGEIIIYDLDRLAVAPLRLPNLWNENSRKGRPPVLTLALHPRDVGKILIGYSEGAAIYSFKQNKITNKFQYELPPGAPGGRPDPEMINSVRNPRLTHTLWHPTGTFVLTAHGDSSIVIWDVRDGRIIMARTIHEANVNRPMTGSAKMTAQHGPVIEIAWCSKSNPDETGILVAGGASTEMPGTALTFLDFGLTLNYATSSWQILADHFACPKRQHMLPTAPGAEAINLCLIPRTSPHHAGSHDPIAMLTLLSSGEVMPLSFPSGRPLSASQLPISLSFVQPFLNRINIAAVERPTWLRLRETRRQDLPILNGGAEAAHSHKRYEHRDILQTSHTDGSVRIWDPGHGDEIENDDLIQIELGMALRRYQDLDVATVSMAAATGELAVGMRTGEVIIYRWGRSRQNDRDTATVGSDKIIDITQNADPLVEQGLMPRILLRFQEGSVTALKISDVGFVGIGFESGKMVIIDMRGPAVIYDVIVSTLAQPSKRSSVLRSAAANQTKLESARTLEFGILTLDGDGYSSILCFVGTNLGRVLTLKLLPNPQGNYTVQCCGSTSLDGQVLMIAPLNIDTGAAAHASQVAASGLREGIKVNGVLVAVSSVETRIFKPASTKGAHKSWDNNFCYSAAIVEFEGRDHALVGIFGDRSARAYSLPALKEIAVARLDANIDMSRLSESLITTTGDIFVWTGPSEVAAFHVWRSGQGRTVSQHRLFNPEAVIPPRPTISNLQWISGSQYVSAADMDLLIGGPDRPVSRRMREQARVEENQRRLEGRSGPAGSSGPSQGGEEEGYWAYMQRQINERTEKLGIVGESMEQLQEQSSGWAKDVSKYVNQQKKKAVLGDDTYQHVAVMIANPGGGSLLSRPGSAKFTIIRAELAEVVQQGTRRDSGRSFVLRVLQPGSTKETVSLKGCRWNLNPPHLEPSEVSAADLVRLAFERFKHTLFHQNIIPTKFHPRGAQFEPAVNSTRQYVTSIDFAETSSFKDWPDTESPFSKEAYTISILSEGHIQIEVASAEGALHALETLAQIFYLHSQSNVTVYTPYAPVRIADRPAFEHRGLNLDISRNRIFPGDVMRVIDGMAANKLNKLHIHTTDAQSWPLHIPALPDLALKGAYDASQIWSPADLEEVQRHGMLRGVEVFLEIDLPGHATSIANAYPDLILAANKQPWTTYALEPPSGQLKLNSSEVYSFLTTLLQDLFPRTHSYSSLFHLGGDELNRNVYGLDPTVNSTAVSALRPLLQAFFDHLLGLVDTHKLTPIFWEETVLDWNLTLPEASIIQTWRSPLSLPTVLNNTGHRALFGDFSHWYLDCGHGIFIDSADPSKPPKHPLLNPPYLDYCSPYKNWRHVYSYDPLINITESQKHRVLGGEVHLWGELIDSITLDGMLWPRAAAAAEVLWRGPGQMLGEGTTRRLAEMRERLVAKGIMAGVVTMEWCLRNKGGCTV